MHIKIKNMVCDRCILVIKGIANELGLPKNKVTLGEINFAEASLSEKQNISFKNRIEKVGFEVIVNKGSIIAENIKTHIITFVNIDDEFARPTISDFLRTKLNYDYNTLSRLFSQHENTTIEQYLIAQKIEKVKELISYGELTLTEISQQLGYSSLGHLSNQFKKITKLSPSQYKKLDNEQIRKTLDKV